MELFKFTPGNSPLLVNVPHAGTYIPPELKSRMTAVADELPDTDWHIDKLYDFAPNMGASMLVATHSRFVIDLNRSPDDKPLYPGQDAEGLCPLGTGRNDSVYKAGMEPDAAEVAERCDTYWRPYHARLRQALDDIKAKHGYALLWDAHSIKSRLPRFFQGKLWDLNFGTNNGKTCAPELEDKLKQIAVSLVGYTHVMNGRYIGGYITRHYGDPANGVQAVQLEQSWATYMQEEPPYAYDNDLARRVRPVLQKFLRTMLNFRPTDGPLGVMALADEEG